MRHWIANRTPVMYTRGGRESNCATVQQAGSGNAGFQICFRNLMFLLQELDLLILPNLSRFILIQPVDIGDAANGVTLRASA